MSKYSDTIRITIKLIEDDDNNLEDKKDLIVSQLKGLIDQLECTNGNMQSGKSKDDFSVMDYVHLTNQPLDTLFID